jgi:branched-chain amino acid aminotransferase
MYAFVNDQFLPLEKATLNVSDLAIQRGYGIFDFFKVQNHVPLFLDDYLDRFYNSASSMYLQGVPVREKLKEIIFELIRKNELADAGVKMILTGGYSPDGYQIARSNFIITEHTLTLPTPSQVEQGIKIITHEYRRDLPSVKTINYIVGVWLQKKVAEQKASDVLYHFENEVTEFPRCNFFIVNQDNTVITPYKNILKGITRKRLLELSDKNLKVIERTITLQDLKTAKEAFLTSTTKRILPIVQINEFVVGDGTAGKITRQLYNALRICENAEIQRHQTLKASL